MEIAWSREASSFVRTSLDALLRLERAGTDTELQAARATNALPVYLDMGGALCFTPEGRLLFYDWGTESTGPENDEDWTLVAAVSAAEKFPELREILPKRPPTAAACSRCDGTGKLVLTPNAVLHCGTCFGLGWV